MQWAIGHAGIKRDIEIGGSAVGVLQCTMESFACQVVEAAFGVATEDGHGDAGDIDIAH
ncbi:hypothetical protein D9M71_629820 [compost metagenome]